MLGLADSVSTQPVLAAFVAIVLVGVSLPIIRRQARRDNTRHLYRIMAWSLALHLLMAPVQIFVVDHVYHGITDYTRYVDQGSVLGARFDNFDFSIAHAGITTLLNGGTVSIAAGIVFALVGVNKLAAFLVFGWFAFLGSICFFRAFAVTFPDADRRRYALLIFFLPSLLFWTAGISKETVMYVAIGVCTYGAARVLARMRGGFALMVLGMALGIYVRPHEFLLLFGALVAATMFRPPAVATRLRRTRRIGVIVLQLTLLGVAIGFTQQLAKHGAPVFSLNKLAQNNSGEASSIAYSSSPAAYPRDIYTVLFDPLPFNFHGSTQLIAAAENTVLVGLLLTSWRRLRVMPKAARMRPYVMLSLVYTAAFCYVFPALGNLGLIDRERVLCLPFFLVLLAVPVSPKGSPSTLPWEMGRRRKRGQPPGTAGEPVPAIRRSSRPLVGSQAFR